MLTPLVLGTIGMGEVLVIVLIVLLLFGAKRIPELMKGIGQGVRSFKEGMNTDTTPTPDDKEKKQDEAAK